MSEAAAQPARSAAGFWYGLGIPLVLALVVHAMAVLALVEGWTVTDESSYAPRTEVIEARLIELEAMPAPAEVVERPSPTTRPEPTPREPRPAPQQAPARTEPTPAVEPEPAPPPEPETAPASTRQSDFEDDALREMLESSLDDAIASEAALLGSQRADAAVASYVGTIVRRIEQNWSRPPSARNGMQATLLIGLVPTGEVVSVEVTASSGNTAFDRSAQVAVRDAAPFEVPDDPVLFDREFRRLRILFRPEDLRN